MRIGAIDIGTNSTRLLVAEVINGKLHPLVREIEITRLGRGVNAKGQLQRDGIRENAIVLKKFRHQAEDFGVDALYAVATSAVRDAANKEEFLQISREVSGVDVEIISGEEEAHLSFCGVYSSFPAMDRNWAVCDVGGGSTEFIWNLGENVQSINIGCVRLTEMFLHSDPPGAEEISKAAAAIKEQINKLDLQVRKLVGVGGTITTLVAMEEKMKIYLPERVQGYVLKREQLDKHVRLLSVPLEERKRIVGLQPKRADVILAGVLIVREILDYLQLSEITVSDADILSGIIYKGIGELAQRRLSAYHDSI